MQGAGVSEAGLVRDALQRQFGLLQQAARLGEAEPADQRRRRLPERAAASAGQRASERAVETAREAIALHTTAEIPQHRGPEIALCQLGIACDIRGIPAQADVDRFISEARNAYPWLDLHEALLDALVGRYHKNPGAASSHAVADACERRVPGFRRFNLCDVLLANR